MQAGNLFIIYLLKYQAAASAHSRKLLEHLNELICNFLDRIQNESLDIWKLPTQEKKQLVYYLELACVTSSDWRMFADELGYSYAEISRISRRNRSLERPTVLLFNLIISKYPTFSLQELIEICKKEPDCFSSLVKTLDIICHKKRNNNYSKIISTYYVLT